MKSAGIVWNCAATKPNSGATGRSCGSFTAAGRAGLISTVRGRKFAAIFGKSRKVVGRSATTMRRCVAPAPTLDLELTGGGITEATGIVMTMADGDGAATDLTIGVVGAEVSLGASRGIFSPSHTSAETGLLARLRSCRILDLSIALTL